MRTAPVPRMPPSAPPFAAGDLFENMNNIEVEAALDSTIADHRRSVADDDTAVAGAAAAAMAAAVPGVANASSSSSSSSSTSTSFSTRSYGRAARVRCKDMSGVWKGSPGLPCTYSPHAAMPPYALRFLRHGYEASVSYLDSQVGRLLGALEESGLRDQTLVVVTSDHGFALGDHVSVKTTERLFEEGLGRSD